MKGVQGVEDPAVPPMAGPGMRSLFRFNQMKRVRLKLGRDESLRRRHPWVFSGAVQTAEGSPESGQTVQIVTADGQWLAAGAYSPESQIRVRAWSFDPEEEISPTYSPSCASSGMPVGNSI